MTSTINPCLRKCFSEDIFEEIIYFNSTTCVLAFVQKWTTVQRIATCFSAAAMMLSGRKVFI